MSTLNALKNHVIFQFMDETTKRTNDGKRLAQFSETTDWGFEISSFDESAKQPRWGVVISVGPRVTEIAPGDLVLVESLKWTTAVSFQGELFWRTDDDCILLVNELINDT